MRWISLISSIQMQKNTSSQVNMEHSPVQITSRVTNQTSVNIRKLKSSIFSDHNAMRQGINYKKKTVRNTNTWRLSNTFLNSQQVTKEVKREIKKFLETNDNENMTTQNLWDAAKAVKREIYSITILPQETRKTSNRQPNFIPKTTGKRTKNNQNQQKERNNKDPRKNKMKKK